MTSPYLEEVHRPGQTVNPLFNLLGVKVEAISPEATVLSLPLRDDFIQGAGIISGGILTTLADEAMAHAALASLAPGESTATIELNVRFLRPARADAGPVTAEARVLKKGRQILTVEADVRDHAGKPLVRAGASFFVTAAPR